MCNKSIHGAGILRQNRRAILRFCKIGVVGAYITYLTETAYRRKEARVRIFKCKTPPASGEFEGGGISHLRKKRCIAAKKMPDILSNIPAFFVRPHLMIFFFIAGFTLYQFFCDSASNFSLSFFGNATCRCNSRNCLILTGAGAFIIKSCAC